MYKSKRQDATTYNDTQHGIMVIVRPILKVLRICRVLVGLMETISIRFKFESWNRETRSLQLQRLCVGPNRIAKTQIYNI